MFYVLKDMPQAGAVVIFVILALFAAALAALFIVCGRYRRISNLVSEGREEDHPFLTELKNDFSSAYKDFGQDTNTPGIITGTMGVKLNGLLLAERFLNNAVSLFVTLGLFGTFLGLSLSVTSLTRLISYSNTSEWLSVLDSVGGGLMSALSGMGVAFYTSLVGAGCSILLTILRTIFNPQSQREKLATQLELWLDHEVGPMLPDQPVKGEEQLIKSMISALDRASESMESSLNAAGTSLRQTMEGSKPYLVAFHQTVEKFNSGVRDFSEFDYNLRGSVERLDLAVRDLSAALRKMNEGAGR